MTIGFLGTPGVGIALNQNTAVPQKPITPDLANVRWIDDSSAELTIERVMNQPKRWQALTSRSKVLDIFTDTRWYKWGLPRLPEAGKTYWISIGEGAFQDAQVWFLDQNGKLLSRKKAGLKTAISDRAVKHHRQIISFMSPKRSKYTAVFRLSSIESAVFSPSIWTPAAFTTNERSVRDWLAAALGVLLAIALLAASMAIWTRDPIFKYLSALAMSFAAWCLNSQGYMFLWIWPGKPEFNLYAESMTLSLMATFLSLLGMQILDRGKTSLLRALRQGQRITWIAGLFNVATLSMVPAAGSMLAAISVLFLALLFTTVASFVRWKSGERDGAHLLVGMVIFAMAALVNWLVLAGRVPLWWPDGMSLTETGAIGALISMLWFTTGAIQRQTSQKRLQDVAKKHWIESHQAATNRLEETVKARTFELQTAHDQLSQMSRVDGLTGVHNRRYFDESLRAEVERSGRSLEPVGIVMIDLDHFKRLNDEHGHAAGDLCLKEAARLASQCVQDDSDLVARYGGEEFVALLVNASPERAMAFAERVRAAIENHLVHYEDQTLRMTASLGVYCDQASQSSDEERLLKAADTALYAAKNAGRNRVCYAGTDCLNQATNTADTGQAQSAVNGPTAPDSAEPILIQN